MREHAANLLTATRAVLIIPLACIPLSSPAVCWAVLGVYLLLVLTDWLDGQAARRWDQVSDLGKILDPTADRLMLLIFVPLLSKGYVSVPLMVILWSREVLMFLLRTIAARANQSVPARASGKWRTAIIYLFAALLLLGVALKLPPAPSWFTYPTGAHAANYLWFIYDQAIVLMAWTIVLGSAYTLYDYAKAYRGLLGLIWRDPRRSFASLSQGA